MGRSTKCRGGRVATCAVLLTALAWVSLMGGYAAAQTPAKLGITPVDQPGAFFDLAMSPGESRELSVELGNFGDLAVEAVTFSADAYTIANGGFGARLRGEPRTGTTLWVTYPEKILEIPARSGLNTTFRLSVPSDASSGQHITSLVIQNLEPIRGSGQIAINQINRQAIAILITLPGPLSAEMTFGEAHHKLVNSKSVVYVDVTNPGSVLVKPEGDWVLEDSATAEIARTKVGMDSFYARTSTIIEVPLDASLKPGKYWVSMGLQDSAKSLKVSSGRIPLVIGEEETAPEGVNGSSQGSSFVKLTQQEVSPSGVPRWVAVTGGVSWAVIVLVFVFFFILVRRRKRKQEDSA